MSRGECFEQRPDCPYFASGCFTSTHHLYWPRTDYTSVLERTFRDLPENKVPLCRDLHDLLHFEEEPSPMPPTEEMRMAVDRAFTAHEIVLSAAKKGKLFP